MCLSCGSSGQYGTRTTDHRIPAIAQPGRTGVVGLTRDLDPPPTVRPEPASHRHGTAKVDQTATLLDMWLDEGSDASECLGIRAQLVPAPARRRVHRLLGHSDPVRVTQCSRSISAQGAGDHARSGTRTLNRAPSSSTKLTMAIGRPGA
jgi:hypothetical protein